MSIEVYKAMHFMGLLAVFLAFGAVIMQTAFEDTTRRRSRQIIFRLHGIGLILILISGIGMINHSGVAWPWPGWLYVKILVWLAFGGILGFVKRGLFFWQTVYPVVLFLGAIAIYVVLWKPF